MLTFDGLLLEVAVAHLLHARHGEGVLDNVGQVLEDDSPLEIGVAPPQGLTLVADAAADVDKGDVVVREAGAKLDREVKGVEPVGQVGYVLLHEVVEGVLLEGVGLGPLVVGEVGVEAVLEGSAGGVGVLEGVVEGGEAGEHGIVAVAVGEWAIIPEDYQEGLTSEWWWIGGVAHRGNG